MQPSIYYTGTYMVKDSVQETKYLINEYINFSANYLTLDFLEGISDDRLRKMEVFASKFSSIFNSFKSERDFESFRKAYDQLSIGEKRIVLELISYTKNSGFMPFLLDIAKSNSFHSIDAVISIGQMEYNDALPDLESMLNDSNEEVYSKVLKSVINSLKKEQIPM